MLRLATFWPKSACVSLGRPHSVSSAIQASAPIFPSADAGKTWQQSGTLTGHFNGIACSVDGAKWVASEGGIAAGYIYTLQVPPAVAIGLFNGAVLVSWSASTLGFSLEQNPDPRSPTQWLPVTNAVQTVNGKYLVTMPCATGKNFFRLRSQ